MCPLSCTLQRVFEKKIESKVVRIHQKTDDLSCSQGGSDPSPIMTRGLPYKATKKEEDIINEVFDLAPYLEHTTEIGQARDVSSSSSK